MATQWEINHDYVAVSNHLPCSSDLEQFFPSTPVLKFTGVREPVARVYSHFIQIYCAVEVYKGEVYEKDTLENSRQFAAARTDTNFN